MGFPRHFEAWKEASLWPLHRSLVGLGSGRFCRRFGQEIRHYSVFRDQPFSVDKMAESCDRSSSTEPQLKFPGCSHYRRRSDNHFRCQQCRLNEGLTLRTKEAPCHVCKDWLPEAWRALEKVQPKRKRKAAAKAAKRWTTRLKSTHQKKEFKFHPSNAGMTGRLRRKRERNQPPRLRLWRQSLPTGLPGPMTRRRPFHPASLWLEDPGPMAAQCLPGPTDLNAIDQAVVIGADEVTGRRDVTTHQGPVTCLDVEGVGSGPGPCLRAGPALEPGMLTQQMLWPCFGRATEGQPFSSATRYQRHHSRSSADRRSRSGSQHYDRHESVDNVRSSCPRSHHNKVRREPLQWSLRLPDQLRWTTRQVWWARQTRQLWPTRQEWRAPRTRQRHRTQQVTRQQWISARQWRTRRRLCTTQQLLPTQHRIRTRQLPTQHTHRTQQVTTWQGVTGRRPRVPQQGLCQLQDKTLPWFLMSAVWCFRLFREVSTRRPQLTLRQCGLSCNEGWTRVWQLQTPSPGPLIRHRRPDMIRLCLEDPGLQSGIPGPQSDDPGLQSGVPEGWGPEIPLVHGLPLEDRPPQNLAPGMLHQSTFQQLWTQRRKSRTGLSLKRKMTRDLRRKSQRHNISCFARLWHHLRACSRLTLPSLAGLPGRLWSI